MKFVFPHSVPHPPIRRNSYSDATSPSSPFFKLIHAQTGRALSDNGASLAQEGVFDGDELIMVRKRE